VENQHYYLNWVNKAHQPSTSNKDYGYVVDNTTEKWKGVSAEITMLPVVIILL
jgi:hypothetical protein